MYEIFFPTEQNDKAIEDFLFPFFYSVRYFLVHLLKFESDTATSKDIAIISKPKSTITSHCYDFFLEIFSEKIGLKTLLLPEMIIIRG